MTEVMFVTNKQNTMIRCCGLIVCCLKSRAESKQFEGIIVAHQQLGVQDDTDQISRFKVTAPILNCVEGLNHKVLSTVSHGER